VIPIQALAELFRVLTGKGGRLRGEASSAVRRLASSAEVQATSPTVLDDALELASRHGLQIFDAIMLAAAAEARCDLLLTEHLQDGFAWRGVVVCNPFGPEPDPRIAALVTRRG
jgi:predicted nucleic acid-binding protein